MCGRHNELRRGGRAAAMLQLRVHVPGTGGHRSLSPLAPPGTGTGRAPATARSRDVGSRSPGWRGWERPRRGEQKAEGGGRERRRRGGSGQRGRRGGRQLRPLRALLRGPGRNRAASRGDGRAAEDGAGYPGRGRVQAGGAALSLLEPSSRRPLGATPGTTREGSAEGPAQGSGRETGRTGSGAGAAGRRETAGVG